MPVITGHRAATAEPTSPSGALLRFTVTGGRASWLVTISTLLLAAAVVAGCTVTVGARRGAVDPARISASLTRWLKEQYPGLRVGSVDCPRGVKTVEGASFECTADMEGARLPIAVTITHVAADNYDVSFKRTKALVNTDTAVKELQSNLPVELANATVECGTPRVRVVEVGGTIDCTIADGGKQQVVRAVVDNVDGKAHFELADQQPARPEVATGKLGDKLTIYDEFGDAVLEVTFTRVKFSSGDEFDQPTHGLYMGAHVKAHALADDQDLLNLYARVGGQLYETAITGSDAFDPQLDPVTLNKGERTAGWSVFDVPARHGQLVLRDLDEKTVGVWKY
jgi:hypothetical protein